MGSLSHLPNPGIDPRPGLLHCRWILFQLIHKGNPGILERVTFPIQELNWGFLHCRQILYQLSYQGEASNALIPKPQNTTRKENYR